MVFSSPIFLFVFLPLFFIFYKILPAKARSWWLLVASLVFYAWGEPVFVLLMLLEILFIWVCGLLIEKLIKKGREKAASAVCFAGVAAVLFLLIYFKYTNLLVDTYKSVTGLRFSFKKIALPIGISFYSFQALSYLWDVKRQKIAAQRNPGFLGAYIAMFPQLIAGPIVRYENVAKNLAAPVASAEDTWKGFVRFCVGLGKKVIIANSLAKVTEEIFAAGAQNLSASTIWLAALAFAFQIYYDFSGYSDMAIGMAKIFGFNFRENFNLPYTAKNITEFWSRWHISLSSFLKDYLYIPLGGNRVKESRIYLNLLIVFAVCGLWHGAAWTFVVWGIYHGVLRATERYLKVKHNFVMSGWWGQLITILLVMVGWVMFRCSTVSDAFLFLGALLGLNGGDGFVYYQPGYYVNGQVLLVSLLGMAGALIPFARIKETWRGTLIHGVYAVFCLVISMIYLSDATFNPFIYFQF